MDTEEPVYTTNYLRALLTRYYAEPGNIVLAEEFKYLLKFIEWIEGQA